MATSARPPELESSRPPTADELKSLPAIGHKALHVLEDCIANHHIAEINYRIEQNHHETILLQPAFIRYSSAHHIVVWGIPDGGDHLIELRLDRIAEVRDTGDVFEPTW